MKVKPADLRTAASAVDDVVESVKANVPTDVGQVSNHLPGSLSGPAATRLSTVWTNAYQTWATSATQYAEALRASAKAWEDADAKGSHRVQGAQGGPI